MTSRIYYTDSYCPRFDATVTKAFVHDGRPAAVLDRTAFYPTSGGQPFDTGRLIEAGERRGPVWGALCGVGTIEADEKVIKFV